MDVYFLVQPYTVLVCGTQYSPVFHPQDTVCAEPLQSSAPLCGGGGVIERGRRDKTAGTKCYTGNMN